MPIDDLKILPVGSHTSDLDASSAVEISKPSGFKAGKLIIQAIDQNIRITLDNSTPTTSHGFRVTAGNDPVAYYVDGAAVVKVIEEAATAEVQYIWSK